MRFTIKSILSTIIVITIVVTGFLGIDVTHVEASSLPEYIKVGLKYGNNTNNQYQVTFTKGVILGTGNNGELTELASFEDINSVAVSFVGGIFMVTGTKPSGEVVAMNEGISNANCIMPYDYKDGGIITLDGVKYRGGVMFNSLGGGMNVINYLPVEEYLYGVVNGELNKSNPIEALKAQAVAARSYAACKLNTHNSYGFDLCATTHCQMYKGYSDEYPEIIEAVDKTQGKTVNYKGKPVAAFFFKNSGGYTQNSEDVWTGNTGYLKAIKDEYSPVYPWSKTYTLSELSAKLSAGSYNVGTITNVAVTKRNQSGAVETLQFTGTGGTSTLQKDKIRSVLGTTDIKSTIFTFGSTTGTGGTVDNSQRDFVAYGMSNSSSGQQKLSEKLFVVDAGGIVSEIDTEDTYVHDGSTTKRVKDMVKNSQSSKDNTLIGVENTSSDPVTFTGNGYGHGVGLPQDSAVEMAKQGFTYEEILEYYYTDITVE